MTIPDSKDILKNARDILKSEGQEIVDIANNPRQFLEELALPGMQNSKDTLTTLYSFKARARRGILGKLKSLLQDKIVHTTVNVMEKQSMRQQKFNELTFRAIEALTKENEILTAQLNSLKKK